MSNISIRYVKSYTALVILRQITTSNIDSNNSWSGFNLWDWLQGTVRLKIVPKLDYGHSISELLYMIENLHYCDILVLKYCVFSHTVVNLAQHLSLIEEL